jgi:hypothetical protein
MLYYICSYIVLYTEYGTGAHPVPLCQITTCTKLTFIFNINQFDALQMQDCKGAVTSTDLALNCNISIGYSCTDTNFPINHRAYCLLSAITKINCNELSHTRIFLMSLNSDCIGI